MHQFRTAPYGRPQEVRTYRSPQVRFRRDGTRDWGLLRAAAQYGWATRACERWPPAPTQWAEAYTRQAQAAPQVGSTHSFIRVPRFAPDDATTRSNPAIRWRWRSTQSRTAAR